MPKAKKKSAVKSQVKKTKTVIKATTNQPIRIVLEIILRELAGTGTSANLLGGVDKPTITYEFITEQITLISLSIEDKTVRTPPKSGSIELDFIPLTGQILINAYATGQGRGALQLTYLQKKLLDEPAEFKFSNGQGFINQKVKIA